MAFGSIYNNADGHLPGAPGRVWHEADINYVGGLRGGERIVYSSDGLIFVMYDNYRMFAEIVAENKLDDSINDAQKQILDFMDHIVKSSEIPEYWIENNESD